MRAWTTSSTRTELRQRFFLATQRAPFTWVYRRAYAAAVRTVVRMLGGIRGVVSIYLTSGMLDEPVYGLSDVDLTVLVETDVAREEVLDRMAQLRRVLPMLPALEELAVYTLDELPRRFDDWPFLQYRWRGPRPVRLLHGPDVLARCEPTTSRTERALAEIDYTWGCIREVIVGPRRPYHGHAIRKAIADVARAIAWARGEVVRGRGAAIERAAALGAEATIDAALAPAARPHAVFAALHALLQAWAVESSCGPPQGTVEVVGETLPADASVLGGFADVSPRRNVWLDAVPGTRPACVQPRLHVRLPHAPGDAELRALGACRAGVEVTVELGDVVYPFAAGARTGVALRALHPEMFDGGDRIEVDAQRFERARTRLEKRRRDVASLLDGRRVFQLDAERRRELVLVSLDSCTERRLVVRGGDTIEAPGDGRADRLRLYELHGRDPVSLPGNGTQRLNLSVVICTRNRAAMLRGALEGIVRQGRAPDEVVIVDNGSTDDTADVIESFRSRLPLVCKLHPIPGLPGARNAALDLAAGDVLCFTDDDAVPEPDWLERLEEAFLADPHIGLVGGETRPARSQVGPVASFFRRYQGGVG